MFKNLRYLILTLVALAIVAILIFDASSKKKAKTPSITKITDPALTTSVQERGQAPDFEATDIKGQKIRLSQLQGKPVLLNFWASWCESCKFEMVDFQDYYDNKGKGKLEILAINLQEDPKDIKEFATVFQLKYPILPDENGDLTTLYKVRSVPTSILIDKKGQVAKRFLGPITQEVLNEEVEKLN